MVEVLSSLVKGETGMKAFSLLFAWVLLGGLLTNGEALEAAAGNMSQTVSGGGVTVKVTYLNSQSNEDPRFGVALDTHSVALDGYDLKSITVLRDDTGKTYSAIDVANKGSGHHREATLSFPKLSPEAKRLEIVIKDVAGVKERIFRWNLE
jgi:hypothetical protein